MPTSDCAKLQVEVRTCVQVVGKQGGLGWVEGDHPHVEALMLFLAGFLSSNGAGQIQASRETCTFRGVNSHSM